MALLAMNHMLYFFLCSFIFYLVPQLVVEAKITGGFTVEIIHRDSPLSPFYNSSSTHGDLTRNRAIRSFARANHYFSPPYSNKIDSPVIPSGDVAGEYLMKFYIGYPPVEILAIVDTGSDLIWVQCQPNGPVFNPLASSSYVPIPCHLDPCQDLPEYQCDDYMKCSYSYNYADGSYSTGLLAFETLTFDSPTTNLELNSFHNSVFGCDQDNGGLFSDRTPGVVGLGRGPLSLVSQLGTAIQQKFSYCLTPPSTNLASKLRFGPDADSSTTGVALPSAATPLLSRSSDGFYYLNLEGISVGDNLIINKDVNSNEGNMIIDSGTTLTLLESSFYDDLKAAVKKVIGMEPEQDPLDYDSLCYETKLFNRVSRNTTMVFHFTGANVTLSELNIFNVIDDKTCLAMVAKDDDDENSIYGNLAQVNFHIVYDLRRELVSFAPTDCTLF